LNGAEETRPETAFHRYYTTDGGPGGSPGRGARLPRLKGDFESDP
jgi:hypothetical protein